MRRIWKGSWMHWRFCSQKLTRSPGKTLRPSLHRHHHSSHRHHLWIPRRRNRTRKWISTYLRRAWKSRVSSMLQPSPRLLPDQNLIQGHWAQSPPRRMRSRPCGFCWWRAAWRTSNSLLKIARRHHQGWSAASRATKGVTLTTLSAAPHSSPVISS